MVIIYAVNTSEAETHATYLEARDTCSRISFLINTLSLFENANYSLKLSDSIRGKPYRIKIHSNASTIAIMLDKEIVFCTFLPTIIEDEQGTNIFDLSWSSNWTRNGTKIIVGANND